MKNNYTRMIAIIFTIILTFFSVNTLALKHKVPPKPASNEEPKPPPSDYCAMHPKECTDKSPVGIRLKTARDKCIDKVGNGDGFVSPWEINSFGHMCP